MSVIYPSFMKQKGNFEAFFADRC